MVGTPTLQMFFGLVLGAFCGLVFGWPRHPLLGIAGLVAGAVGGVAYAGLACFACGATLDRWVVAARARRHLAALFGFLAWLAISAFFVGGAFALLALAAR